MLTELFEAYRCALPQVGAVRATSARAFARHTHDQFGIGLIDHGAQTPHSGRGQVVVQSGDIITVNPGEVHDGLPVDAAGRKWRMLYFDPSLIAETTQRVGVEFCWPAIRNASHSVRFGRLFSAMTARVPEPFALLRDADLTVLLAAMCDRPVLPLLPANIAHALARLQDDPATPVSLAALADIAGLSRFHLLRSFAAATGLTPHAFQMQGRLHLARRLIAQNTPLAEAAVTAGFADQSHLTRLFHRSFGLTPGAYARAFV